MTDKKENGGGRLSRGQILFCVMSILAMLVTFICADIAIESMSEGLRLCALTVIPSLFPFMVLSELLVSSGAAKLIGRHLARPLSRIFGLSSEGAAALALGLVCGFPIGSKSAVGMYESGQISRGELEHLLSFCNIPSSAFLISAVGVGLFGSQPFGLLLYVCHIISALTAGLLGKKYFSAKKKDAYYLLPKSNASQSRKSAVSAFTEAVRGSAGSMLTICAFVVFFSALLGILSRFMSNIAIPDSLRSLLMGFFEMTSGVSAAANLPLKSAPVAAAAITGWSGLSVAFQLTGICGDTEVSLKPYFIAKVFCAIMNSALVTLALHFFGYAIPLSPTDSVTSLLPLLSPPTAPIWLSLFIGGCVLLRVKKR